MFKVFGVKMINNTMNNQVESEENEKNNFSNVLASKLKRLTNMIIDDIVIIIIYVILDTIFYYIAYDPSTNSNLYNTAHDSIFKYFDVMILLIIYYFILEITTGRTIGKLFTKTKVLNLYGDKPNFDEILKRTFSRIIPLDQLSFLGKYSVGWHDSISKTKVVNK